MFKAAALPSEQGFKTCRITKAPLLGLLKEYDDAAVMIRLFEDPEDIDGTSRAQKKRKHAL